MALDDAGVIINPLIAEGQRHGGLAQGAAQALLEEVLYDAEGNPTTSTFADYPIVSATEVPSFELVASETPTSYNPLGAKGIGEAGTIGSTPAVQNAIIDARGPPRRPAHRHAVHAACGCGGRIQDAQQGDGELMRVSIRVNGRERTDDVEPRLLLAHYLREVCGLKATNIGCDTTSCGACTVIVDGLSVKSCTVLTVQADGAEVTTLEGLAGPDGELHPMQAAFRAEHGLQCGFCTPGMVMAAIGVAGRQSRSQRPRGPGGAGGQPLPLHRLPQHRAGGAGRGPGRSRRGSGPAGAGPG